MFDAIFLSVLYSGSSIFFLYSMEGFNVGLNHIIFCEVFGGLD